MDDGTESRFWWLIHGSDIHPVTWKVGEQILALSSAVCEGAIPPRDFTFSPRRAAAEDVTISIRPDQPLDLISARDGDGTGPQDVRPLAARSSKTRLDT